MQHQYAQSGLAEASAVSQTAAVPAPRSPLGYTATEVANILHKNVGTIYDWIAKGWIAARRYGRNVYIPRRAVWELLDLDVAPRSSVTASEVSSQEVGS